MAIAAVGLSAVVASAEPPSPPPYYAIENVRVVTGAGETLEGATVLLADGLISAVGVGVATPPDAWVVDGSELTLYPGLIDAMTPLGIAKDEPSAGGGPGGGGPGGSGPTSRGPQDRPKTTTWLSAADELDAAAFGDEGKAAKWREAGFTSVVATPEGGIFAGRAAVVNLGRVGEEDHAQSQVLAADVAHRVSFDRSGGFRNFPGSLMGVIAYIQQILIDADHYAEANAVYAADPGGTERPAYDRALEPLERARAAGTPFLLPADLPREIDRALVLADDHELATVLYGGQGGYARAEALAAAGVPVLVSLDWPEEGTDVDPEADTPFRTLYHRRKAPGSAAALQSAGATFAFYSAGLASTSEFFAGVRSAVEAGLAEEDALAALTSGPAAIFGVERQVGTIETGKIANLVLASDWPWAEGAEIEAVFVDGVKYQERAVEEESEPPAADVSGTWALVMTTPRGTQDLTATLEMSEDGEVTGDIVGETTTAIDDGRMSGSMLRFKTTREMGGRTMTGSWTLEVEGETLAGTMSAGPMGMEISGERTAKAEAKTAEAEEVGEDEEPTVSDEELDEVMAVYQGPVEDLEDFVIVNATIWTLSQADGAPQVIENGNVVVRDGKIASVDEGSVVPSGSPPGSMPIFDAEGGHLIPGIMDAHAHIAIEGGVNEGSIAVTSMVGVGDVLDPDDIAIYRALAGGVTTANLLHGSANPIGGQNQVIKLRWGADAEGLKFDGAAPGIKFALGENPKRSNFRGFGIPQRYPQTRMGVMDVIRQAFTAAQSYRQEWEAWEAGGRRGVPPRRDLQLEALVEILDGERLVHSHCYRADEIVQLLDLADELGFRVATLQHVLEGYKVADEIAAHGAGASTFSDWWGYKVEAYDAIPYNAALMTERGVLVSINSDSGEEMRHLNQEAAKAIKWGGLDEVEALKLVTLNPAIQFGLDDRIGSIEPGKDADLVLYDGNPLSTFSVVQKTFVDGDLYFDITADRERQAKIDAIKAKLDPDEDGEEADDEGGGDPPPTPTRELTRSDAPYSCRHEVNR